MGSSQYLLAPLTLCFVMHSASLTANESEDLPDMDLLIYLGGWEIEGQEAQEPLYWHDIEIDTNSGNDDNTNTRQQDAAYEE